VTSLQSAFERQVAACQHMGSPFTARVLQAVWRVHERQGLFAPWPGDATDDAVPLRVAGALHAMALRKATAELAAAYATLSDDNAALELAIQQALAAHPEVLADYLSRPPQTNEIGRSAVLLLGFAAVAQSTGLPLRCLEIGASAGLNQLWHRYRYDFSGTTWGDANSPVLIRSQLRGAAPTLPASMQVAQHSGCDAAPIDLHAPGAAQRLASYVWVDQTERLQRLRAAMALAQAHGQGQGLPIARQDALPWLHTQLAAPQHGVATVVYHSVVWQYLPAATQRGVQAALQAAAQRASATAPLAWLAFEPNAQGVFELTLQQWPSGQRQVLAQAHPHGTWVQPVSAA
jgi:hypothetical protein